MGFQKEALAGAGEKFLAANAKKPGVKVLPSGLQYKVITEGHGEGPKASFDEVEVIYEGRLIDGTVLMLHPSMVATRLISSVPMG